MDIETKTWEEVLGRDDLQQQLNSKIEPTLRKFILRCGDFCQATYDGFNDDNTSPNCGQNRYPKKSFLQDVRLPNASNYQVFGFLYASSGRGFCKNLLDHPLSWAANLDAGVVSDTEFNWMGYVAAATDEHTQRIGRREIYVVWRGTTRLAEWSTHLAYSLPESAMPLLREASNQKRNFFSSYSGRITILSPYLALVTDGPKIHGGWLSMYNDDHYMSPDGMRQSARKQIKRAMYELIRERYKDEKISIVITGHSLGGALAVLSAFDLVENVEDKNGLLVDGDHVRLWVVAFGCPKVGNDEFRKRVERHRAKLKILHVKNVRDLVPQSPTSWWPFKYHPLESCVLQIDVDKTGTNSGNYIRNKINEHNLKIYLHTVAGWNGKDAKFDREAAKQRNVAKFVAPEE